MGGGEKWTAVAAIQKEGWKYEREREREGYKGKTSGWEHISREGTKREEREIEREGDRDGEPERNRRNEFISANATS